MRFLILFLLFPFSVTAQINTTSWGVEDTSFCIIKSIDFFVVHDYLELYNYEGTDLNMRWIRETAPDWPIQWEAGFTDPDSAYSNVLIEDSADFILPYPVAFSNKLIINVDHNDHIDTSYLRFKVFPVNHPADTLWLTYCIIITSPDAGLPVHESGFNTVYDPATRSLWVQAAAALPLDIKIFSVAGNLEQSTVVYSENDILSLSHLTPGIYLLQCSSGNYFRSCKLVVN